MVTKLLAVLVIFTIGAHASEHKSHAVACQALLMALDGVPATDKADPLTSLRDLQLYLRRTPGLPRNFNPREMNGYSTFTYFDSLLRPNSSPNDAALVLSHLAQLEDDSISNSSQIARVGVELRGGDAVQDYLASLEAEYSELESSVGRELDRRYPRWRKGSMASLLAHGMTWGLAAAGSALMPESYGLAPFVGASFASLYFQLKFSTVPRQHLQRGLETQMEIIQGCGHDQCSHGIVDLVAGSLVVPASFHRALLREKPPFDATVAQAEPSRRNRWDMLVSALDGESTLDRTESPQRLFYDSLFYVDPVSHEPVWLIYYRALKQAPIPRKPKPRTQEAEAWWTQSPIVPGLVPVPAEVRR